ITDWISKGTNWAIKRVDEHTITIVKYTHLRGSSYLPLPNFPIKNKDIPTVEKRKLDFLFLELFQNNADLMKRKGTYKYNLMNDFGRFDETSLPPEYYFYDQLKDKE
ncbi:hypothetical protein MAR_007259, partial [Mya arenaria]